MRSPVAGAAAVAASVVESLRAASPTSPPMGMRGDRGLFGPDSQVWHIARERRLLLGGPAALLLQVAHPLVAAGVDAHSDFRAEALQRLARTLDVTLTLTFGDSRQAAQVVTGVRRQHDRVRGVTADASRRLPAGTPYAATDPQLLLWVHTTLVCTALEVHDLFVGRLTWDQRDRYHREMTAYAVQLGVPAAVVPANYADLQRFSNRTVEDCLSVGPTAHRLSAAILDGIPSPLRPVADAVTAQLLPPSLREAYRLLLGPRDEVLLHSVQRLSRASTPLLPPALRFWPHYRSAVVRVGAVR